MKLITVNIIGVESRCRSENHIMALSARLAVLHAFYFFLFITLAFTQNALPETPTANKDSQLNVNWLYGFYIPKEVPLESLTADRRFKLYIRQTYATWGIYIKTTLFAARDQAHNTYPEWGDGLLGWEPRYDRCRCSGSWPRTRHAIVKNFVTYDRSEKSLHPQLLPYLGAFTGSVTATTWEPGNPNWEVKGYQAVITQVPVGMAIDWIGEFAPEIARVLHRHKKQ